MLDLKLVQRYLMLNFWVMAGVCLLIVVLYETEVLLPLEQFDNPQLEFFLQVVMEFASIIVIPVALKLFSIPSVRRRLLEHKGSALITWGTARIQVPVVPPTIDTFLDYHTTSPGFRYLAIIHLWCLSFAYPSMGRCMDETTESSKKD